MFGHRGSLVRGANEPAVNFEEVGQDGGPGAKQNRTDPSKSRGAVRPKNNENMFRQRGTMGARMMHIAFAIGRPWKREPCGVVCPHPSQGNSALCRPIPGGRDCVVLVKVGVFCNQSGWL